ncbi:MAG TPA: hypothetical protein VN920_03830 [Pyrinomonadaceae bacterium]|nr:hypothetical protein [Pyrinomonadaceae bacterium]
MEAIGAVCFGVVIGWITYRTLRRKANAGISDIASVIGAVGGATVTALFGSPILFGYYSVGLAIGFFGYLVTALFVADKGNKVDSWMMRTDD